MEWEKHAHSTQRLYAKSTYEIEKEFTHSLLFEPPPIPALSNFCRAQWCGSVYPDRMAARPRTPKQPQAYLLPRSFIAVALFVGTLFSTAALAQTPLPKNYKAILQNHDLLVM